MTIAAALGFWAMAFVGVLYLTVSRPRYANPNLHDGYWELEKRFDNTTVYQTRYLPGVSPDVSPGHKHRPHQCTISDSLAHVDVCACGAERYGVYGAWT